MFLIFWSLVVLVLMFVEWCVAYYGYLLLIYKYYLCVIYFLIRISN